MPSRNVIPYVEIDAVRGMVGGVPSFHSGYHLASDSDMDDGIFAEWKWDGDTLRARVDWLGVQPLFYGEYEGRLVVSPNILAILDAGIPADFDYVALGVFFRIGFLMGNDTVFKHVRAFPPAGELEFSDGKLVIREGRLEYGLEERSRADEISGYIELFRKSMERRVKLHGEFIQPLSGGRDSRHILAELARLGKKPIYTYTVKTNYRNTPTGEEQTARAVSERLGIEHRVIQHSISSELEREAAKNLLTSFTCDEGSWMMGANQILRQHDEAFYDGFLGDVLSAYHWVNCGGGLLDAYQRNGRDGFIEAVVARFFPKHGMIEQMLKREFGSRPEISLEAAKARMAEHFDKYNNYHNPITNFFMFSRGRREIAMSTWGCYPWVNKIMAPFLDRELFMFLISQPERTESSYAHQRSEAIVQAYPELSRIPFASTSPIRWGKSVARRVGVFQDALLNDLSLYGVDRKDSRRWGIDRLINQPMAKIKFPRKLILSQLNCISTHGVGPLANTAAKLL